MLSKTSKYGIKAILHIAYCSQQGLRVGVPVIAEAINAPKHFTGKILQTLAKAEILSSIKGPNGGFEMSENQRKKFNIKSIVVALDGNGLYTECALGLSKCNDKKPCPVHEVYAAVRDSITTMHTKDSIDELAKRLDDMAVLK